jgi:nucleotide-binding universal stress UspA family protein
MDPAKPGHDLAEPSAGLMVPLGLPGIHVVTERGPAPRVLLRDYRQAQLLVVGARHRWLLQGRTVRCLTRRSPVPVVIVPPARPPGGPG